MESLGSLNVFVYAAETGSYVAAGRQLGVSASAVGKAIARIEDRLGVKLFHRSTRSITLTPEGKLYLERCRRILSEVEAAELELSQLKTTPKGKLRISLPLVGMLFMPVMANFMKAYPDIELDLDFTDRLVDIIDEGFDVVVRTGDVKDSRLMSRVLGKFEHRLVASLDYLQRQGTPTRLEDLKKHSCLLHKYPSTGKIERWPFKNSPKTSEMALPGAAVVSTIEPLIFLAEQGLGIACLPVFSVQRQLEKGSLKSVLEGSLQQSGSFRALWPASRFSSPKLRVFVDFLAENLFKKTRSKVKTMAL